MMGVLVKAWKAVGELVTVWVMVGENCGVTVKRLALAPVEQLANKMDNTKIPTTSTFLWITDAKFLINKFMETDTPRPNHLLKGLWHPAVP